MGFFKKLGKIGKKAFKLVARPALSIATAGLSEKAIALGKNIGSLVKGARGDIASRTLTKIPKPQLQALILKTKIGTPGIAAQTMPGGARIAGKGLASPKRRKAVKKAPKRVAAAKVKRPKGTGGIKDFKALSASWNAAGKPGKWIDWVRTQ